MTPLPIPYLIRTNNSTECSWRRKQSAANLHAKHSTNTSQKFSRRPPERESVSSRLLHGKDLKANLPERNFKLESASCAITVVEGDALEAAHELSLRAPGNKVAILSMASELRPGGGFLLGANSQEESLCMRTTLYPSLPDAFYRLPEVGCIYTQDVCVFCGSYGVQDTSRNLKAKPDSVNPTVEWWFVDVISCAAVRGPDLTDADAYADPAQRDLMREKIKCIFRAAALQGCRRLVLGAFGCGAFGNPPKEVAALFKRVLLGREGSPRGGEFEGRFDEVVFAIKGGRRDTLPAFREIFE
ncbi:hypothetical protein MKEN_00246400 [Mycena kentingensis (nom. inval.)]|nr:hypothetical protein MKEN_00246400 [Mycena kentingensis (nom. inval.)]